ncbi:MAG TPA: ATP-binding cassette domain-containing protein [Bacillota bacterium]|jgi:energy-coupling factor transporter ATP-binding protein EcfA2|nr:ATP-binding cassette domain-containing protein [Peptococcaceae bacterium MAG4]HPZ44003.1 ATP-binding cassette domain-containing protein [Bacillota bacterium]HQD76669.1 ATP-binding cassette domain-containing protein [Bacillota bacterium]HUM59793.1 ATP-binding cassette domain-containing protein [Bacillota bacterium]
MVTLALLEIENFSFSYPRSEQPALREINLKVEKGEFIGITGPTGAGKSTLTYCLNGIIPHFLGGSYQGRISLGGTSIFDLSPAQISRLVGSVFQDPEAQLISPEVEQEVAFGPENLGLPPAEIGKRIGKALELAGIPGLRNRPTANLSGGEKQRVAIAAALAMLPEILVLDEPTSELDPLGTDEIFKVLDILNKEHGMTIIMVEQKTEQLAAYASRILVFNEGRIALEGEPRQVFVRRRELEEIGVRIPQVARLAGLLGRYEGCALPLTVEEGHLYLESILRG